MTVKLSTTVNNIESDVLNIENKQLLLQSYDFMKRIGTSERYQNNNLKAMIAFSKNFGSSTSFYQIKNKSEIVSVLDTKIKTIEEDPDKRWITTWNDYLVRIRYYVLQRKMQKDTIDEFMTKVFSHWLEWRETVSFLEECTNVRRPVRI